MRENAWLRALQSSESCHKRNFVQAWVDRTDSALDYTDYAELDRESGSEGSSKAHRFSCGPFKCRRYHKVPELEPHFLFSPPVGISEEPSNNLEMMWP